ncbi:DNA-binding proteins Bright/BRCAA1/rbp1 [Chamberlinius hualienensis]
MATEFLGKFKLVSSDKFEDYMKALGVGMVTRKMANTATPVQTITEDGNKFTIKTETSFKTTVIEFELGKEFDENTADGRKVKTTVTKDGNKLIQTQKGDKDSVLIREFNGNEMKMTLKADDVVCTRVYQKQ